MPQNQGGPVTAGGCLVKGTQVRGGDKDNYALAHPRKGPIASVPDGNCSTDPGAPALDLKDGKEGGITDAMLGKYVQVSGILEKETSTDPNELRELDVKSAKLIPVVPPPPPRETASAAPAPRPAPAPAPAAAAPAPAPAPEATVAKTLPKTASNLPMLALFGLVSLAGGYGLRSLRLRRS